MRRLSYRSPNRMLVTRQRNHPLRPGGPGFKARAMISRGLMGLPQSTETLRTPLVGSHAGPLYPRRASPGCLGCWSSVETKTACDVPVCSGTRRRLWSGSGASSITAVGLPPSPSRRHARTIATGRPRPVIGTTSVRCIEDAYEELYGRASRPQLRRRPAMAVAPCDRGDC
jgi:hypothetical protein